MSSKDKLSVQLAGLLLAQQSVPQDQDLVRESLQSAIAQTQSELSALDAPAVEEPDPAAIIAESYRRFSDRLVSQQIERLKRNGIIQG